jgi:hypothetical protein
MHHFTCSYVCNADEYPFLVARPTDGCILSYETPTHTIDICTHSDRHKYALVYGSRFVRVAGTCPAGLVCDGRSPRASIPNCTVVLIKVRSTKEGNVSVLLCTVLRTVVNACELLYEYIVVLVLRTAVNTFELRYEYIVFLIGNCDFLLKQFGIVVVDCRQGMPTLSSPNLGRKT